MSITMKGVWLDGTVRLENSTRYGSFFPFNTTSVKLNDQSQSEHELFPLLESLKEGKFKWLIVLDLVFLSVCDMAAAGSDSCAAEWQQNRR